MEELNHPGKGHQSRIDFISDKIRSIAFKEQQTTIFQIGDEVEVASQEGGFIGSYYNAIILYPFGAYYYKVQYKTLVIDDESTLLEGYVNVSEVRPVPPDLPLEIMLMKTYYMVDVYANEGWWFGVITRKIGQTHYVYFPTTDDTIAYSTDELRFHQEWYDGEWIFP